MTFSRTLPQAVVFTFFILLLATGGALAFHSGGVGECEGCHTMHNSREGMALTENGLPVGQANRYLLKGSDAGSTCLNCHQQTNDTGPTVFHISTPAAELPAGIPPKQLSPGGDFGWLKKSYTWIPSFGAPPEASYGDRHGHNIVANDFGYTADMFKSTAPGGVYPAGSLSCISCHDPHGKYRRNQDGSISTSAKPIKGSGSYDTSSDPDPGAAVGVYRLLGGIGYSSRPAGSAFAFSAAPPVAVAPRQYNRSESAALTRVAYGTGMSEWCKNCHSNIHTDSNPAGVKHPSGSNAALTTDVMDYYNQYVKTGDLTGTDLTSYSSLAPFEVGTANVATLKSIVSATPSQGPRTADGTPAVMCLSCHRAHATGWDGMTRWNPRTDLIVSNGRYSQEGAAYQPYGQGRTEQEAARAYYDIPAASFAPNQQKLCYKCHATLPQ